MCFGDEVASTEIRKGKQMILSNRGEATKVYTMLLGVLSDATRSADEDTGRACLQ